VLLAGYTVELYGPETGREPSPTATQSSASSGRTAGASATAISAAGPGRCLNTVDGYSIEVPEGWWYTVNGIDACSYLDRELIVFAGSLPRDPPAIAIYHYQTTYWPLYEPVSVESISIGGFPATRWELRAGSANGGSPAGTLIYEYVVNLGTSDEGPTLVADTDSRQPDYEQNKLVLDEIMATLTTP
jgi:hypothetical protein